MTTEEMVDQVKHWIVDQTRTTKQSLNIAENIRDLCEEWIDILEGDLEIERRTKIEARSE